MKYNRLIRYKIKKIIVCFSEDITTTSASKVLSINRNTINSYYNEFRECILEESLHKNSRKEGTRNVHKEYRLRWSNIGYSRFQSSFEAMWTARRLANLTDKNLIPAFASANIKILPYQIAAARFALRSTNLKGCILCDEGSLGKTYEALLVVSQRWYEGKEHILIVLPQNLMPQWQAKLAEEFTLPLIDWKDYTQESKGLCIITYDEAVKYTTDIEKISWDLAVFDESYFLFKPDNKSVVVIKKAIQNAFKLFLTPTPITMSIMDIYGLIHFIDESLLPDADSFYKRYFRKPENYPELPSWVSQFAFRTLKNQVEPYVNFTRRIPVMLNYSPQGTVQSF